MPQTVSLTLISSDTLFHDEAKKFERLKFEENLIQTLALTDFETFLKNWYDNPLFLSLKKRKTLFEKTFLQRSHQNKEEIIEGFKNLSLEILNSDLPDLPTLAIYGMFDQKYRKLYSLLPQHVNVVSLPNAGHALHLENPSQLILTCEKFVRMIES